MTGQTERPLLLALGNPDRGDDALGPALIDALAQSRAARCDCLVEYQLQPEHVLDLQGRSLVLLIDASLDAAPPYRLREVAAAGAPGVFSHSLSLAQLLALYERHYSPTPHCFELAIKGDRFELGEPIGPAAADNLRAALVLVEQLLADCRLDPWRRCCTDPANG